MRPELNEDGVWREGVGVGVERLLELPRCVWYSLLTRFPESSALYVRVSAAELCPSS